MEPQINADEHGYFNPRKHFNARDAMEYQVTPRSQLGAAS
jgi:hypothetical protein